LPALSEVDSPKRKPARSESTPNLKSRRNALRLDEKPLPPLPTPIDPSTTISEEESHGTSLPDDETIGLSIHSEHDHVLFPIDAGSGASTIDVPDDVTTGEV
jgi:hypothetical protein